MTQRRNFQNFSQDRRTFSNLAQRERECDGSLDEGLTGVLPEGVFCTERDPWLLEEGVVVVVVVTVSSTDFLLFFPTSEGTSIFRF